MATNNAINVPLSGSTGTGTFVGNNSPTLVSPILGSATATSIYFNNTQGVVGVTDNSIAMAQSVGEIIYSNVLLSNAVSLTTNSITIVTSISLTAGDWDLYGNVGFTGNAATIIKYLNCWIGTTLGSPNTYVAEFRNLGSTGIAIFAQANDGLTLRQNTINLSTTTTLYLLARASFTVSTCLAFGKIWARRTH